MKKYYSSFEKDYSIKEILKFLLKKVWLVVLCAVVFGALLGFLAMPTGTDKQSVELDVKDKQLAEKYVSYITAYEGEAERLEESIAYNLNPHAVVTTYSQYYVDSANEVDSYDIVTALREYLKTGGLAYDVAETSKLADALSIHEVIILDEDEEQSIIQQKPNVFGIKIYGEDEASCVELNAAIKQALEAYADELDEVIAENDLVLISSSNVKGYNDYLYAWQRLKKEQFELMNDDTQAVYNTLSKEQKDYAYSLIRENEEIEVEMQSGSSTLKYAVMGAALGVLLSVAIFILYYIFSSTVKTEDELQENFDVLYMGNMSLLPRTKWDMLVEHILEGKPIAQNEQAEKLCAHLSYICKKDEINKLAMLGEDDKSFDKTFVSMQEHLGNSKMSLVQLKTLSEESMDCENLILAIIKGKTKCQDIINTINICTARNIRIVGYVVID